MNKDSAGGNSEEIGKIREDYRLNANYAPDIGRVALKLI
jgi:hypothetical protein